MFIVGSLEVHGRLPISVNRTIVRKVLQLRRYERISMKIGIFASTGSVWHLVYNMPGWQWDSITSRDARTAVRHKTLGQQWCCTKSDHRRVSNCHGTCQAYFDTNSPSVVSVLPWFQTAAASLKSKTNSLYIKTRQHRPGLAVMW